MNIGEKIKSLRLMQQLTQEELAQRSEVTKGFISQVERDLASPSVATFLDILDALGTRPEDFFGGMDEAKIVFSSSDASTFISEDEGYRLEYIVPNAQKNAMEPTRWHIESGGNSSVLTPFEGQWFAYILKGELLVHYGEEIYSAGAGDTLYGPGDKRVYFENASRDEATLLWVSNPPNF
ncbi:MAG: XRE family transcriptional regulator [Peptoniphilus sp.]|nr:XRE family transcriptional regulator [Peptoniphilus sp.]MDD7362812.1 XRE family transcriptional regulator [Bacillota bacterium]MDY6043996.1 XRE family transcriptional regulator [Peptoniphilus sp.]